MQRDEIVAKLEAAQANKNIKMLGSAMLAIVERAGLTIIPAVADEQEIERVAEAIALEAGLTDMDYAAYLKEARAAAAAVRPTPQPPAE